MDEVNSTPCSAMSYKRMKKIVLTFVICLITANPSFAQNNMEAMRFLTVNSLMEYGQRLYDRGDFNQASAVFNHVLIYDSHQAQALQYLKKMGATAVSPNPIPNNMVLTKSDEQIVDSVNISDAQSLKQAIEAKKRIIQKLQNDIVHMRENIASQSKDGL